MFVTCCVADDSKGITNGSDQTQDIAVVMETDKKDHPDSEGCFK